MCLQLSPLMILDLTAHAFRQLLFVNGVHSGRAVRGRSLVLMFWVKFELKRWMTLRDTSIHLATYNQATTKLAFHSNETSKDKLSIIYNWLSFIVIQVNAKLHKNVFISTCS